MWNCPYNRITIVCSASRSIEKGGIDLNNYPSPKLCPNCGNSVSPEDSFCPVCGAAVPTPAPQPIAPAAAPERRCASCGTVVPDGAAFCSECGAPVPAAAPVSQPAPAEHRCASCGELLDADAVFCGNCGAKVVKNAAPVPPFQTAYTTPVDSGYQPPVYTTPVDSGYQPPVYTPPVPPAYQPPVPPAAPKASLSWWPGSNRLSDLCGSGSALTMAILVSVSILMSLISGIGSGTGFIGTLISNVSVILFCIGLWMCFAGARKRSLTTGGFTVLSAGLIYSLVMSCILLGLVVILSLILVGVAKETRVLGIILLLISCGILALVVVYNTQLRRAVKSAKQIVIDGQGQIETHMYSIVLMYIGAGCAVLNLISTLALQGMAGSLRSMLYGIGRDMPSSMYSTYATLIGSLTGGFSFASVVTALIAAALPIIAALTLHRLHKDQTVWVR